MQLSSMAAVEKALAPYYAVAARTTGRGITVARMERLMKHLGNPEQRFPTVHIAGTSGKTSTTYFTAALLHSAGKKVGSTVSPHVDSITERVQINGHALSEPQFCAYMGEFLELVLSAPEEPSWFECMVAFAFWVFAREKVDYAVLETGLGGLHDATNVSAGLTKLCIITDIGFDHQAILGNTLMAIASQKAGIIHEGNPVLMYEQAEEIMKAVYFKVSQTEGAELYVQQQERLALAYGHPLPADMPQYQQRNWLLAYAAFRYLANRDGFVLPESEVIEGTQHMQVPARMEEVVINGKTIIMDGAHNEAKMRAFLSSFRAKYGRQKVPVLLALKEGKELDDIAPLVAHLASRVIVTEFATSQDLPLQAIPAGKIAAALRQCGVTDITTATHISDGYSQLMDAATPIGVVTGSFYLISELRTVHKELRR